MTEISNEDLVNLARLGAALYSMENDDPELEATGGAFERGMRETRDDPAAAALVMMAIKLLGGSGYQIISNNPETIARARALAAHLGAVTERRSDWADTLPDTEQLHISPPLKGAQQ